MTTRHYKEEGIKMKKLLVKIFSIAAAAAMAFSLTGCFPEKRSGAEQYDKAYYIREYGGDLRSNLSVFPDTVEKERVNFFKSSLMTGLFDTDGYILLEYRCDEAQMAEEEERLSSISFTITHPDGQTFTNNILYDPHSYAYPAYIATDGFGSTYEYALIDREGSRIIYVFGTYVMPDQFPYKDYLKKDLSGYKKDALQGFTVYNHSFDGEKSWDEFNDGVTIGVADQ